MAGINVFTRQHMYDFSVVLHEPQVIKQIDYFQIRVSVLARKTCIMRFSRRPAGALEPESDEPNHPAGVRREERISMGTRHCLVSHTRSPLYSDSKITASCFDWAIGCTEFRLVSTMLVNEEYFEVLE